MNGILEYKSISGGHVKDVDRKTRTVTGYASVFGNVDYDNDIIEKGAFTKSINERLKDIYYLYNHNWEKPIDKGSKGVKLYEDDYGLKFEATIPEGLSYGNDLIILYEEQIVDEHSIGFQSIKVGKEGNSRLLKELKLYEFSAVTMAANPLARLEGIKSSIKDNNERISKILKLFKNGNLTDETYGLLELSLKQLQLESFELGKQELKSTQNEQEPPVSTLISIEPQEINNLFTNFKI